MNTIAKNGMIAFLSLFVFVAGCNAEEAKTAKQVTEKVSETVKETVKEAVKTEKAEALPTTPASAKNESTKTKPVGEKMSANPIIKMETSKGTMTIELDAEKAPLSAANFVSYVEDGFYDGLIFHRVIPNFMVQGGDMNPDMSEKTNKAAIKNEANNGLKNDRGTLAMARTGDPHSATSQFFINLKDNDFLNHTNETQQGWGYTVFGKVTEGLDTIDEIAKVKTGNHGGHGDVPLEAVTIIKASVVK